MKRAAFSVVVAVVALVGSACANGQPPQCDCADPMGRMTADFVVTAEAGQLRWVSDPTGRASRVGLLDLTGVSTRFSATGEDLPSSTTVRLDLLDEDDVLSDSSDLVDATFLITDRSANASEKEGDLPSLDLELVLYERNGRVEALGGSSIEKRLHRFVTYLHERGTEGEPLELLTRFAEEYSASLFAGEEDVRWDSLVAAFEDFEGGSRRSEDTGHSVPPGKPVTVRFVLADEQVPRSFYEVRSGDRQLWAMRFHDEVVFDTYVYRAAGQEWTILRKGPSGRPVEVGRFDPNRSDLAQGMSLVMSGSAPRLQVVAFDPN